jgi:hypothetical protein
MSKRESVIETHKHLKDAEYHLQAAEQSASSTGDAALHQTVKKLRVEVSQTHQEITRKSGAQEG